MQKKQNATLRDIVRQKCDTFRFICYNIKTCYNKYAKSGLGSFKMAFLSHFYYVAQ